MISIKLHLNVGGSFKKEFKKEYSKMYTDTTVAKYNKQKSA